MAEKILLYLIRHGETRANSPRNSTFRGWSDIPLDASGKAAAIKLAQQFSRISLSSIISSDIPRAVETAQTISPGAKTDADLRPWNVGMFTGKERNKFMPLMQEFVQDPSRIVPRGESLDQFQKRVLGAISSYAQHSLPAPIAIVTHGSVITAIKRQYDPKSTAVFLKDNEVVPGGVLVITSDGKLSPWSGAPTAGGK